MTAEEKLVESLSKDQLVELLGFYHAALKELTNINNGLSRAMERGNEIWTKQTNTRLALLEKQKAAILEPDANVPPGSIIN